MSTPNYDDGAAAYNASKTVEEERKSGVIDPQYYKGIPGLLKLLEVVLSLIGFICVQASGVVCVPYIAVTGFFSFVTMAAFTLTLALYIILLLKLQKRIFRCDCVNWPLVELSYYSGVCIFFFFGALFLALQGCHGGHKAGTAFGFFALAAFCVDLVFAVRTFLASRNASRSSHGGGTGTDINDGQRY